MSDYKNLKVRTESLTPLRGQLLAAFKLNPPAGPPLSVVKIIIELSSIPLSLNAFVTLPTDSSKSVTMAEMLTKYSVKQIAFSLVIV